MKIVVTTSDHYHHLLKIFVFLFERNWSTNQPVEIVGYKKPDFELPPNFTFYSLGTQSGNVKDFSNDLRSYFEKQDEWFIWMFEDTFIKSVDFSILNLLFELTKEEKVGRINLTGETLKQDFIEHDNGVFENTQTARYRLSTQPSIWRRDFLLQYLKPNLSPWDFETQESINDGWRILGLAWKAVKHNEGVCKKDIYNYDLSGISEEQVKEMKELKLI